MFFRVNENYDIEDTATTESGDQNCVSL